MKAKPQWIVIGCIVAAVSFASMVVSVVALITGTVNVDEKVSAKLDAMVQNGSLSEIMDPLILNTLPPLVVDSTDEMTDTARTYILRSDAHVYQYEPDSGFVDTEVVYDAAVGAYDELKYIGTAHESIGDLNDALAMSVYLVQPEHGVKHLPRQMIGYLVTLGTDGAARVQYYIEYTTGTAHFRHTVRPFSANRFTDWSEMNADQPVADSAGNENAKLLSVGNSIMTGSVWRNGKADHLCEYENAPYGIIANAINIPRENVDHVLLSNAGLLYDAGAGSFLDEISQTDLADYDALLTHLYSSDMRADFPLGDLNSTAGDGTIIGGVLSLLDYMRSSNGMCQLILVSVPPVSKSVLPEDDAFSAIYGNGNTLVDLDRLLSRLAEREHFIFIDWQDLNVGYYYHNYTDGMNVHADNEDIYRIMGAYLAGRASAKLHF